MVVTCAWWKILLVSSLPSMITACYDGPPASSTSPAAGAHRHHAPSVSHDDAPVGPAHGQASRQGIGHSHYDVAKQQNERSEVSLTTAVVQVPAVVVQPGDADTAGAAVVRPLRLVVAAVLAVAAAIQGATPYVAACGDGGALQLGLHWAWRAHSAGCVVAAGGRVGGVVGGWVGVTSSILHNPVLPLINSNQKKLKQLFWLTRKSQSRSGKRRGRAASVSVRDSPPPAAPGTGLAQRWSLSQ